MKNSPTTPVRTALSVGFDATCGPTLTPKAMNATDRIIYADNDTYTTVNRPAKADPDIFNFLVNWLWHEANNAFANLQATKQILANLRKTAKKRRNAAWQARAAKFVAVAQQTKEMAEMAEKGYCLLANALLHNAMTNR